VIPSGIDLNIFQPTLSDLRKKLKLEQKHIVLGVSNRFNKSKGTDYFIRLANHLPEEYKLVLIGVKENQRRFFGNKVLTLPRTNNTKELAQFYSLADVFVNPTLQETQGLTNIEALACGTGVVTFNSGGSPDCIDESCGTVVARDDFKGLMKAVVNACRKPFDQEACMKRAKLFDKTTLYREYIKLYEDVIRD
jgi:glycosyltransferase involved in cell wall biosynthesis